MEPMYKKVNGERIQLSEAEKTEILAEWEAQANKVTPYDQLRREAFKEVKIEDQMDELFQAIEFADNFDEAKARLTDLIAWRRNIKNTYPKDEG